MIPLAKPSLCRQSTAPLLQTTSHCSELAAENNNLIIFDINFFSFHFFCFCFWRPSGTRYQLLIGRWSPFRFCLCLVFQADGRSVADTDSATLEQKFLSNDKDVVNFTAGSQSYSLSFQGKQMLRNRSLQPHFGAFWNIQAVL